MATRMVLVPDLAATEALARTVAALVEPGDAILMSGPLGAGKTAFARAFIRARAHDPALDVPSPSFTLVQTYELPVPVAHFDLWRLDDESAVAELGIEMGERGIILVEWPDRLGRLRPSGALEVSIEWTEGEARRISLAGPERLIPA